MTLDQGKTQELGRLARFLRQGKEALLDGWRRRVLADVAVPEANDLPEPVLRDHLPQFVDELVLRLDRLAREGPDAPSGRTVGEGSASKGHARQRFEARYSLESALREWSHFRAALVEASIEGGVSPLPEEIQFVHAAIDGAMAEVATSMHDAATAELAESEERFRLLVHRVRDYAIYMLDPSGKITTWNLGAERTTGYAAEEVLGRHFSTFFTPEDVEAGRPRALLEEASRKGSHEDEGHRVRRDGSRFWSDAVLTALTDESGHLRGFAEVTRDLTERRRHAQETERRAAELEAVIASLPDAVYIGDLTGVKRANRAALELLGFDNVAALNRHLTELVELLDIRDPTTGERLPPEATGWALALRGEHAVQEVLVRHAESGRDIVLRFSASPIRLEGEVIGAVAINTDITDQSRREEQLLQEAEFRERFIGILSHDLRNPLSAVQMGTMVLLRQMDIQEGHARTLRRILSSTDRMTRMIDQVLDLTRARIGGGIPIDPKPADVYDACDQVLTEFEASHPSRVVELDRQTHGSGVWDHDKLAQVLSNLVGNALEHGPPGTPVTLRVRGDSRTIYVDVVNEGPPIPADVLGAIFEPFRRGAPEPSTRRGLGLGLYIVRNVVEAHGGTVAVRSTLGETTFTVELPRRPPPSRP